MTIMVFRAPGPHRIHGYDVEFKVVEEDAVEGFVTDGWTLTAIGAGEAMLKRKADEAAARETDVETSAAQALSDSGKPPTRDELEQMATKLGLPFSPRTSDRKLRLMIEASVSVSPPSEGMLAAGQ